MFWACDLTSNIFLACSTEQRQEPHDITNHETVIIFRRLE